MKVRARDIGLFARSGTTGECNAIVDVPGVAVGHTTLISGEGDLVVGSGPVRTGVTVVVPREEPLSTDPVFAGIHRLNGNGELTGSHWIEESGLLTSPIALTNTHAVGTVRDALVAVEGEQRAGNDWWSLPVVAETWDGVLNDINGRHVRPEHVVAALHSASTKSTEEGNVGGGTGMICHGFKGGIGTSSRVVQGNGDGYVLGVLVQANHGTRDRLTIDGHPVGAAIDASIVPLAGADDIGRGSIITVLATDAPLLPHQCRNLAARAALGIGRVGGVGECWSGDLSIAFSTSARGLLDDSTGRGVHKVDMAGLALVSALYAAAVDATEEAIVNALFAAETMVGHSGVTAHRLPIDLLQRVIAELRPT